MKPEYLRAPYIFRVFDTVRRTVAQKSLNQPQAPPCQMPLEQITFDEPNFVHVHVLLRTGSQDTASRYIHVQIGGWKLVLD